MRLSFTFLLMLSAGGVALTDLQHPVKTQSEAVRTMLRFAGIGRNSGKTANTARAARAMVAGLLIFSSFARTG